MSGINHLKTRIKRIEKTSKTTLAGPVRSVVYMDDDGNLLFEEGVKYNDGLLVVVKPAKTIEEWERRFGSVNSNTQNMPDQGV